MKSAQGLLGKFRALSCLEKCLLIEAFVLHLWIGLLLKVIPFRLLPRLFVNPGFTVGNQQFDAPNEEENQSRTRSVGTEVGSLQSKVRDRQPEIIELIRRAIQRAGKVSPWKNRCLVSSLAGRCMLRQKKIPSQLSLGVAKNREGKTIAHAWLKADNIEIVERKGEYTELFAF